MAATLGQKPNAPVIGAAMSNPYNNPFNVRRYGVTAEDMRNFKNKEASDEDHKHFIISDLMYLNYEKTCVEKAYFQNTQSDNPKSITLILPKSSYPKRVDTAYFVFSLQADFKFKKRKIVVTPSTLKSNNDESNEYEPTNKKSKKEYVDDDNNVIEPIAEPETEIPLMSFNDIICKSFKFLKMIDKISITIGSNKAELLQSQTENSYQNRYMMYIGKPISKSNVFQEYVLSDFIRDAKCLDNLKLSDLKNCHKELSTFCWRLLGVKPSSITNATNDIIRSVKFNFIVPLTMLSPMFNFDTILPPGIDLIFNFEFIPYSKMRDSFFELNTASTAALEKKIKLKLKTKDCYLHIEEPRQKSNILYKLKTQPYIYDVLSPEFYRTEISVQKSNIIRNVYLKAMKNPLPVKIEFMLVPIDKLLELPFTNEDSCFKYVKSIKFNINYPFPYDRELIFDNSTNSTDNLMKHETIGEPLYHSLNQFLYPKFGEQHVTKGFFPSIVKQYPLHEKISRGEFFSTAYLNDKEYMKQIITDSETYFHTLLVLPSNIFNQNPYPNVRGTLTFDIEFKNEAFEKNFAFFCNFYYYNRIHIENGKAIVEALDDLGQQIHE